MLNVLCEPNSIEAMWSEVWELQTATNRIRQKDLKWMNQTNI